MMFTAIPLVFAGAVPPFPERISLLAKPEIQNGVASWYSESDSAIHLYTASGEIFDDSRLACASWNFPFGARLKITNQANGKSVICVVNDRGPARRLGRLVDLTKTAFRQIADPRDGLVRVTLVSMAE